MSKVGEKPINIPEEVEITIKGKQIKIKGPKGELDIVVPKRIKVSEIENELLVERGNNTESSRALHGTYRALLANAIKGVTDGWSKELELVGTGYRAQLDGKKLIINIGFSHPVEFNAPENISFKVEKNSITIDGIDKQLVGAVAADIRLTRPPEPYKGKGIKYKDEVVRRKPGKAAKAAGATGGA